MSVFDPTFETLPKEVPLFPLTGILLLPRAQLPLNIFEPRYINMFDYALAHGRLIAMIQPDHRADEDDEAPKLASIGTLGRITHFEETEDGRYLLNLRGLSRFQLQRDDWLTDGGFRMARPDFTPYRDDLVPFEGTIPDDTEFLDYLKRYFTMQGIEADWNAIENHVDERLIHSLCMVCPFEPQEKQALLEAENFLHRVEILKALVQMAVLSSAENAGLRQ